jgi:O-antigen ligase
LWLLGFVLLPFATYPSLVILGILLLIALAQRGKAVAMVLWRHGFWLLTLGLMLNNLVAIDPGEAWLRLANFVPYFLLFGVLVTADGLVAQPLAKLSHLARCLVLTSLPMSLIALLEYTLKLPWLASRVRGWPIFAWVFESPFGGEQRALALMDHPNILSSYLVIVLGLGLGLTLHYMNAAPARRRPNSSGLALLALPPGLIYSATGLSLVGIFCSGSRNGLLVALFEILLLSLFSRRRFFRLAGLGIAIALTVGVILLGVGGRQLSLSLITQDPRAFIWPMAWDLIRQRPLTGWGLGSFSQLYVPNTAPGFTYIHHAHNIWLYLASEVGIPLMLLFSWVIGHLYAAGAKALLMGNLPAPQRYLLLGYLLAFGGGILFGLFDVPLFDARINGLNWLMLAGIYRLSQPHQQSGRV